MDAQHRSGPAGATCEVSGRKQWLDDHDLASDLAGMRETKLIPPGSELAVEWTAPSRPGSYEFWCAVPGHREAGMTGTIVVK
jgi:uncharacterized cupredoxin-like copper-binding protein